MKKFILAASAAMALVAAATSAHATAMVGGSYGFTPSTVIDFEQASNDANINVYYAGLGVTFGSLYQSYGYGGSFPPNLSGGAAINFTPAGNTSTALNFSINFASVQANAGFAVVSNGPATIASYLGGNFVESVSWLGGRRPGAEIVSFTNSGFDEIRYVGIGGPAAVIDNLAFGSADGGVPEPATWALMIGGFGLSGARLRRRKFVTA